MLMLRVYALVSMTHENPGTELVFDSVQDSRLNMQAHLETAANLVHRYGFIGFADELLELRALVTTTTASITQFYDCGVDIECPAGSAFDVGAMSAIFDGCMETADAPDPFSDMGATSTG